MQVELQLEPTFEGHQFKRLFTSHSLLNRFSIASHSLPTIEWHQSKREFKRRTEERGREFGREIEETKEGRDGVREKEKERERERKGEREGTREERRGREGINSRDNRHFGWHHFKRIGKGLGDNK